VQQSQEGAPCEAPTLRELVQKVLDGQQPHEADEGGDGRSLQDEVRARRARYAAR
jgi:hypothetical protein